MLISFVLAAVTERIEASPEEYVSVVEITADERRERRSEVVVEEVEETKAQSEKQVVTLPQTVRQITDDWFELLERPTREPSYVPPGIVDFHSNPPVSKRISSVLQHSSLFCH